ncbi:MAG TPA: pyruvate formate lyase family protein [bacterium]|nr:pyruvate formate lyase family protein [bacterium]
MNTTTSSKACRRIERLKKRYHIDVPVISVERARYYTEKWRELESSDLATGVKIAMCMKNVYENMTHYVDSDDRIAGYWTENFLGMPIDIERGVFNNVLRTELTTRTLMKFRMKSLIDTSSYLIDKRFVRHFIKNLKLTKSAGSQPMNMGIKTMQEREINRFEISDDDRDEFLKDLLPYWKGKSVVEHVEREVMKSDLITGEMRDFNMALPANTSFQTMMISTCATIASYQGHVILAHEKAVQQGLLGMLDDVRKQLSGDSGMKKDEKDFLRSVEIALEGLIIFAQRLAEQVERKAKAESNPEVKKELEELCRICKKAPLHPAENFREALQAAWTLKTAVELAHPVNLHCFGRLDQILYPYYKNDIDSGAITPEQASELIQELLLKLMSQNIRPESNILSNFYHRYLGSTPITIGGLTPEGADGTNDLTYVFIDAAEKSRAVTNVSIRIHKDSPDELFTAIADTLYSGSSNLSLFNDDVNIEAMQRRGFSDPDARNYAVMGCVEMLCPGKTGGMSANALLLCRVLDMTLRNGDSNTLMGTIKGVGKRTGDPETFKTFEEFVDAFVEQAHYQVERLAEASNIRDRVFAEQMPAPYISAFLDDCVQVRKDMTAGGSTYDLSGISFINSIANVVDSLYSIKRLVFDEKKYTFAELIAALDNNYMGHEELHDRIRAIDGMWGNGYKEVDDLARSVTSRLFEDTYRYKSFKGGAFVPYVISMTTHTIDGRISTATPDGRKAATPYAASCNPFNVEKNGMTGALRSIASLDYRDVLGCAVNMKFHPTAVGKNDATRNKWIALMKSYFSMGGAQLQPTVASADMLRAAQENPGEYADLIVKVGGYSAYFTELGDEIQKEVIERTEHLS